jgi:hypothetical protein
MIRVGGRIFAIVCSHYDTLLSIQTFGPSASLGGQGGACGAARSPEESLYPLPGLTGPVFDCQSLPQRVEVRPVSHSRTAANRFQTFGFPLSSSKISRYKFSPSTSIGVPPVSPPIKSGACPWLGSRHNKRIYHSDTSLCKNFRNGFESR